SPAGSAGRMPSHRNARSIDFARGQAATTHTGGRGCRTAGASCRPSTWKWRPAKVTGSPVQRAVTMSSGFVEPLRALAPVTDLADIGERSVGQPAQRDGKDQTSATVDAEVGQRDSEMHARHPSGTNLHTGYDTEPRVATILRPGQRGPRARRRP